MLDGLEPVQRQRKKRSDAYDNSEIRRFSHLPAISRVDTNSRRRYGVNGEEHPLRRWNVTLREAFALFMKDVHYQRWRQANRKSDGSLPTLGIADRDEDADVPTTFRNSICA